MTHNPKRKRRESGEWGEKKPTKDDRTWWMMRESKKRRHNILMSETEDKATRFAIALSGLAHKSLAAKDSEKKDA